MDSEEPTGSERDPHTTPESPVLAALLENARTRRHLGDRLDDADARVDTDLLGDIVRHAPVLELLRDGPLARPAIEARLEVSRATSHRFTRWLSEHDLVEKVDGRFELTGRGESIADEVLRFEANVRTTHRLGPLLDVICEDHQEFVVEPFVDATVTVADPADPYRPVERFTSLVRDTEVFRGFNTTHMAPLVVETFHEQVFDACDTEIIYLPSIVDTLFETYPDAARHAIDRGDLTRRTRDDLPYGLAIFDDHVGIGGYDESTGQMAVFVDTDSPIAREWAERVYASVRADSTPIAEPIDVTDGEPNDERARESIDERPENPMDEKDADSS